MDVDAFHRLLNLLGWSIGEAFFRRRADSGFWQVDGARNWHAISVSAPSQSLVWALAVRMAGVVQRNVT
jgi:hypothetical protein